MINTTFERLKARHGTNYFGKLCIELALLAKYVH